MGVRETKKTAPDAMGLYSLSAGDYYSEAVI